MHEAINNELYDNNVFDVLDIEKDIQMLKNGRASGFDGLSIWNTLCIVILQSLFI